MLTIFTVVVVFSIVILVHELGHFLMARHIGVKVEKFSLGLGKTIFCKKIGDTEYAIGLIPFGGYVKMAGEDPGDKKEGAPWEFSSQPPGKRFWIIFAGAAVNYIFAFLIFCFVLPSSRIGMAIKDMPGEKSGLKANDLIIKVDDKDVRYWFQVVDIVSKHKGEEPVFFTVKRDKGFIIAIPVVPELMETEQGISKGRRVPKVGITYSGEVMFLRGSPIAYIKSGVKQTFDNTVLTYKFLWYLITGKVPVKGSVTGAVGIAFIVGKAIHIGFVYLVFLVGHINLALAIFNLLPFPVLDGGHIIFLGLEKIRRRPLGVKTQDVIQYAAITLILTLFLFVTYNDVMTWVFKK